MIKIYSPGELKKKKKKGREKESSYNVPDKQK